MTRDEMLTELRTVLRETTYDAAWGNPLLLAYMSEGQDKFCEDTGYFVDRSTYSLTTIVGEPDYPIDERIISVKEIWYGNTRLGKFQQSDVGADWPPTSSIVNPEETSDSYSWQTDAETGMITLYPTPTSIRTLSLRVWRYARQALNTPAEPEIPERFHRAPIHWAAFRALTHHDMEQQDKIKAGEHLAIYTEMARQGRTAFERTMKRLVEISPSPVYVVR